MHPFIGQIGEVSGPRHLGHIARPGHHLQEALVAGAGGIRVEAIVGGDARVGAGPDPVAQHPPIAPPTEAAPGRSIKAGLPRLAEASAAAPGSCALEIDTETASAGSAAPRRNQAQPAARSLPAGQEPPAPGAAPRRSTPGGEIPLRGHGPSLSTNNAMPQTIIAVNRVSERSCPVK